MREVEHSSFTPLVLSATGGLATEATTFYKRLSACLADKWEQSYSTTLAWLRCRLTFSLLRSAIQCIRGARSSIGHASKTPPSIDLVTAEIDKLNCLNHNSIPLNLFIFYISIASHVYNYLRGFSPPPKKKKKSRSTVDATAESTKTKSNLAWNVIKRS